MVKVFTFVFCLIMILCSFTYSKKTFSFQNNSNPVVGAPKVCPPPNPGCANENDFCCQMLNGQRLVCTKTSTGLRCVPEKK